MGYHIGLIYNPKKNIFVDMDGFIVYGLFRLITPGQLMLFKESKQDMTFYKNRDVISLYWGDVNGIDLDHYDESLDMGDDLEKIVRYEKNKWY